MRAFFENAGERFYLYGIPGGYLILLPPVSMTAKLFSFEVFASAIILSHSIEDGIKSSSCCKKAGSLPLYPASITGISIAPMFSP